MYLNLYTYDMIYQTIPNNYDFTANKGVKGLMKRDPSFVFKRIYHHIVNLNVSLVNYNCGEEIMLFHHLKLIYRANCSLVS
jgi:hypothetical protein